MGVLTADLHLPEATSLKDKRSEVLRITQGLRRHCGASVAEVDHHDVWQRCRISVAIVKRSPGDVAQALDQVSRRIALDPEWQVVSEERDVVDIAEGAA